MNISDAPLSSCQEHYDQGERVDGVYTIQVISPNTTNDIAQYYKQTYLVPFLHSEFSMSILKLNVKRAPDISYLFYFETLLFSHRKIFQHSMCHVNSVLVVEGQTSHQSMKTNFNTLLFLVDLMVVPIPDAIQTTSGALGKSYRLYDIAMSSKTDLLTIFSYEISMEQIEALISVSESCEQRVENNCTTNQLTGFSWWLDRNGNKLQYWHGDGDESTLGMWFLMTVFV